MPPKSWPALELILLIVISQNYLDIANIYKKSMICPKASSKPNLKALQHSSVTHIHHTSDAVASFHILECRVDVVEGLPVRDELVHLQLPSHVIVHQIWQLRATFDTAEGTAFPHTSSYELKRLHSVSTERITQRETTHVEY